MNGLRSPVPGSLVVVAADTRYRSDGSRPRPTGRRDQFEAAPPYLAVRTAGDPCPRPPSPPGEASGRRYVFFDRGSIFLVGAACAVTGPPLVRGVCRTCLLLSRSGCTRLRPMCRATPGLGIRMALGV